MKNTSNTTTQEDPVGPNFVGESHIRTCIEKAFSPNTSADNGVTHIYSALLHAYKMGRKSCQNAHIVILDDVGNSDDFLLRLVDSKGVIVCTSDIESVEEIRKAQDEGRFHTVGSFGFVFYEGDTGVMRSCGYGDGHGR